MLSISIGENPFIIFASFFAFSKKTGVVISFFSSYAIFIFFAGDIITFKSFNLFYNKFTNTPASTTVISPDTATERPLIAPSISPISRAFDVPIA